MNWFTRFLNWLDGSAPSHRWPSVDREIDLALREMEARDVRMREQKLRDGLDAIMTRGK